MDYSSEQIRLSLSILGGQLEIDKLAAWQWSELDYEDVYSSSFEKPSLDKVKAKAVNILTECITDILLDIDILKSERSL
jgi:hypothetical protein